MTGEAIEPFLGTWILDLDESEFDQSDLPKAASCRIGEEFGLVTICHQVVTASGETVDGEITGVPGGPGERLSRSGLADRLTLFFEGERTLTSQATRNGQVLMTARRTLSDDGDVLEIEQTVVLPGQGEIVNTGFYRRAR